MDQLVEVPQLGVRFELVVELSIRGGVVKTVPAHKEGLRSRLILAVDKAKHHWKTVVLIF
jgi:hypothetical protein